MVTLIHFIEAYGLNPAIYSAHLKLHPLLVLTVLVVAEHSLGVWGLLLAGKNTHLSSLQSQRMSTTGFEWLSDVSCLQTACKKLTGTVCQNAAVACRLFFFKFKHRR